MRSATLLRSSRAAASLIATLPRSGSALRSVAEQTHLLGPDDGLDL
jgi:hypothetical protein